MSEKITEFTVRGKSEEELLQLLRDYEQSLASEKKYHATLDHMMEGFQIIDFNFRYTYVNDTVVKQSKYTREELMGYTMMEKYPGIENTELFKTLTKCMQERIATNFENEFDFPDGSKGYFELRIQPVQEGLFILSMDITERKRAELVKKEYIKGLEEMIFMTSHKVRQPVAHILGISILLNDSVNSQEDLNKMVGYMKESALSLDAFTKELTSFIKKLEVNARG